MNKKEKVRPEWISEDDVVKWLGVQRQTLYKWRQTLGLNYTNISGKTVMYDKVQINSILDKNSTYAALGQL